MLGGTHDVITRIPVPNFKSIASEIMSYGGPKSGFPTHFQTALTALRTCHCDRLAIRIFRLVSCVFGEEY